MGLEEGKIKLLPFYIIYQRMEWIEYFGKVKLLCPYCEFSAAIFFSATCEYSAVQGLSYIGSFRGTLISRDSKERIDCPILLQRSHWKNVGSCSESSPLVLRRHSQAHYILWGLCVVEVTVESQATIKLMSWQGKVPQFRYQQNRNEWVRLSPRVFYYRIAWFRGNLASARQEGFDITWTAGVLVSSSPAVMLNFPQF